jgi:murein L,D-transpeptidase YafK
MSELLLTTIKFCSLTSKGDNTPAQLKNPENTHETMKIFALLIMLMLTGFIDWMSYLGTPLTGKTADKIVVEKSARRLSLLSQGKVLKTYPISLGWHPDGKKQREGDGRTPEGFYKIDYRNPNSGYHLSLHVSYPDDNDVKTAKAGGYSAGGNIMIHGMKNGYGWIGKLHRFVDWTAGCIAVTDSEMDEIWQAVSENTVIEIKG